MMLMSCFFFQAEDGIRDRTVTGVQTCALPIFDPDHQQRLGLLVVDVHLERVGTGRVLRLDPDSTISISAAHNGYLTAYVTRSEERRVGKECRSRWAADQ